MAIQRYSKLITFAILLCITNSYALSQALTDPKDYNAYRNEKKIPLFIEEFANNKNNWYLGIKENVWFENLQDSTLFFQSFENVPKEDFKDVYINQDKDFEIELKIRFDKGMQSKANGLQWGKSVTDKKQFDFLFSGSGQFTIDKFTGTFTDYIPFTPSKLINVYTYNTLTIRKVGQLYYFFINGQLVHSMPFEPFFGNGVGFQVAEHSSVQIDYLKIWQLCSNQTDKLPLITITGGDFSTPAGTATTGSPVSLKIKLKNLSSQDANNIKLQYKLPENVMLLECVTDFKLKSGEEKATELVYYINKNYQQPKVEIGVQIEGAELQDDSQKAFSLALNQPTQAKNDISTEQYALYRSSNDPLKGLNAAKAMNEVAVGRYFALVIGVDKYSGSWPQLRNAVNDAKAVEQELRSRYEFQSMRSLYNEQATRANIVKEFEWLMANVRDNDNLLIFYSGHGEYKENMQRGFWVPVDATDNSISNLISNSDIQSFLGGIKSKHTFLIADACFSGDIFRGKTLTIPYENSFKYYNQVYSKPSRKALTSGGIEPVMDGGKEGHSVFTYYLLKSLKNNENKFFDASQLYNDIKIAVVNNSNQTPGFNAIVNTGDEGGQFVFIKK